MDILSLKVLKDLHIPLPPIAIQQAIIAEIEAEQRLVSANRELVQTVREENRGDPCPCLGRTGDNSGSGLKVQREVVSRYLVGRGDYTAEYNEMESGKLNDRLKLASAL